MKIKYNRIGKYAICKMLYASVLFGCIGNSVVGDEVSAKNVHDVADICMYSQRLLKDYVLIGLGVKYHNPEEDLKHNSKVVNDYFNNLKNSHLEGKLGPEVNELESLWKGIGAELLKTPNKEKLDGLHDKINKFSHRCEEVALDVAAEAKMEGQIAAVLIAELGMEAQRLAAIYMMKVWGSDAAKLDGEVDEITKEINGIINKLLNDKSIKVSADAKEKIKKLKKPFLMFEFMTKSKSGRFIPTLAENKATEIFDVVREILELEKK